MTWTPSARCVVWLVTDGITTGPRITQSDRRAAGVASSSSAITTGPIGAPSTFPRVEAPPDRAEERSSRRAPPPNIQQTDATDQNPAWTLCASRGTIHGPCTRPFAIRPTGCWTSLSGCTDAFRRSRAPGKAVHRTDAPSETQPRWNVCTNPEPRCSSSWMTTSIPADIQPVDGAGFASLASANGTLRAVARHMGRH